MATKQQRISKRHALTENERDFVRIFAAMGQKNAAEAYRRAFLVEEDDGEFYEKGRSGNKKQNADPVSAASASKKANALLEKDYIAAYLAELSQPAGEHARQVLGDAVLFGDERTALNAADKVIEDEDKLGFREAVEKWAEIMCAIGTEIVLPVDAEGREIVVPMSALFPQYADAAPPREAIEKTIKTLEALRDRPAAVDPS